MIAGFRILDFQQDGWQALTVLVSEEGIDTLVLCCDDTYPSSDLCSEAVELNLCLPSFSSIARRDNLSLQRSNTLAIWGKIQVMLQVGRYRVVREIGRSVDVVYEAEDTQLRRRVAIKELSDLGDPSTLRQRFLNEAQAIARLNHPRIVSIYDSIEENGRCYLIMELIEGETLRQVLNRRRKIPEDEAVQICIRILEGIRYAHQNGVIHRDIKPENIFILSNFEIKIADFGIAYIKGNPRQTLTGQIKGTPSYLSPEQIEGGTITEATDIFAVGVVLFEMIEGYRPFLGSGLVQVLNAILYSPIPKMRHASPMTQQVIVTATEKNPAKRYRTADEMIAALNAGTGSLPVSLPGATATQVPAKPFPHTQQHSQEPEDVSGDTKMLIRFIKNRYTDKVLAHRVLTSSAASLVPIPDILSDLLKRHLHNKGITQLYEHQKDAFYEVLAGNHVGIVAGTASGKTYSFNLPILHTLLENENSTALYLYPTKSLAQDQLGKLSEFGLENAIPTRIYDGDTAKDERPKIRAVARIVLTNPDMLHHGILSNHRQWARFLSRLKFVVVDEMHVYRGVFGANVAAILRRLFRIANLYNSKPQFIFASATVDNADELTSSLIGQEVRIIQADSSPRPERHLIMWRHDLGNGWWAKANDQVADIIVILLRAGIRHITFVRSRLSAEIILQKVVNILGKQGLLHLNDKISSYRSGYLPEQRREIERKMFNGEILGVVSTNALELGIDVGGVDAVIINGYPGNLASFWQQAGRAGRRGRPAVIFFVLHQDPLHAYLAEHPEHLTDAPVERCAINWQNPNILASHLSCAAYEHPLDSQALRYFDPCPQLDEILSVLSRNGILMREGDFWRYIPDKSPHHSTSIRSKSAEFFSIRRKDNQYTIGKIDIGSAYTLIYPNAIYLHEKESFLVVEVDDESKIGWVKPIPAGEYTEPLTVIFVHVIQVLQEAKSGNGYLRYGILKVKKQVVGYKRKVLDTDDLIETVDQPMPPIEFLTTGIWWSISSTAEQPAAATYYPGLHAVEHTARSLAPVFTGCDTSDVGSVTMTEVSGAETIAFFLYDEYEGGLGICESLFPRFTELMKAAAERIKACDCDDGCPRCILLGNCSQSNQDLDKSQAIEILDKYILNN